MESGELSPGSWHRVRIPLSELNPEDRLVTRVNIQNMTDGAPVQFWLDELRLVVGDAPSHWVYLPATLR